MTDEAKLLEFGLNHLAGFTWNIMQKQSEEIARQKQFILALADKLAICSKSLTQCAEKKS